MSEIDFSKLKLPFPAADIEWRLQSCGEKNDKFWGKALAYVTNRAIQNRLDEVVGPANWKNEYIKGPEGGILCGLSIKIDGEWVEKYDGAENTQIEAVKGGLSDSMKRAAVQWGIGRYLYNLEEGWAECDKNKGSYTGKTKDGKYFKWEPPTLPDWALPEEERGKKESVETKAAATDSKATTPESATANENLSQAIETVKGYINNNTLTGSWAEKANNYIKENDYVGLCKVINYIQSQSA